MFVRSKNFVVVLLFINSVPYALLFFRLGRILIHESGGSGNPYPGPEDPLGPEFAVNLFVISTAVSAIPVLFAKYSLPVKALILLGVIVAHVGGYLAFIFFAFVAGGVLTGRSL